MSEYPIDPKDVTPQAVRALRKFIDSRGPGEEPTEALSTLADLLERGVTVTLTWEGTS